MDMAPWYYVTADRQRQGPVSASALRQAFEAGALGRKSLVWREGLPQWQPLDQVAAEVGLSFAPTPITNANEAAIAQAYAAQVGADPEARAPVFIGGQIVYAGFLKRFAANFVDSLIVGTVGGVLGAIVGGLFSVALIGGGVDPLAGSLAMNAISTGIGLILGLLYYGGFHSSSSQATPGKLLIGIKVARGDGERLTPMRAGGRFLATYLNLLTLGIGWLMAAFTERKQALHDFICDTVVVDRWAYTEFPERQSEALGGCAIAILIFCALAAVATIALVIIMISTLSSGAWN